MESREWRRLRFGQLADAVGGNAVLGRLLGYQDGAYVGQMRSGHRPITEKTLGKAESIRHPALPNGAKGWFDQAPPAPVQAIDPLPEPPTLSMAVHALAEALRDLSPLGRELARAALNGIVSDPDQAGNAVEAIELAMRSHTPPPSPPSPPRKTPAAEKMPSRRPDGRANLTLQLGGGEKRQLALPLRTVRDPFDPRAVPAREREWYNKLTVAPKAR